VWVDRKQVFQAKNKLGREENKQGWGKLLKQDHSQKRNIGHQSGTDGRQKLRGCSGNCWEGVLFQLG